MSTDTTTAATGAPGTAPRTQIFEVSTLYGAATLAAALDAGLFGPDEAAEERILLVSNNAAVPETAALLTEMPGFDRILTRFDRVLSWNDAIEPQHPGSWTPREHDVPLWRRLLRTVWELPDGPMDLVIESVHAKHAVALAAIFSEADVHVYADGLMSYGPTRDRLAWPTAVRIQRLLHLDLVPGLRPMLLTEFDVPAEIVPSAAFRAVLDEITEAEGAEEAESALAALAEPSEPSERDAAADREPTAVVLGQYLAALNILSQEEEERLHERMVRGAAAAGCRSVVFKPHPTAPSRYNKALEKVAAEVGVRLTLLETPMLAETVFRRLRPDLVVGCFSTALLTASAYYSIPIARVGTDSVLGAITPYENSNRVPLTIVDALVPDLEERRAGEVVTERADAGAKIGPLVRTVGYCMQHKRYPGLRAEAQEWLAAHQGKAATRYVNRARLTTLALPGGIAAGLTSQLPGGRAALRMARKVRRTMRRG
ncbi:hypothetical protein E1265_27880 [Streptomyces sp. 8K308]|uniref:polysialyltransferase family glycosyltransferase n=1 Tax=Streptomyces sp. 8K308 TaxID=2530388 RepID=UPI00104738EC|nr:polysialyltransferase family glycosyltransferase [Streptomyces sp. 8K308]TDC13499.1 hypothetical protein E1265_27880 [Streptomyces sp. 8K308]